MKSQIVQNLTHRGTVLTEGFLFDKKLLSETEIRRRVLSLWRTGAKVFRHVEFGEIVFLQFPQPFRVDCRNVSGLPLVRYDKVLSSFPLAKRDLERFEVFDETILFLVAGSVRRIAIPDFAIEKIENWFDVSDFEAVQTETLGEIKIIKPILVEKVSEINLRGELKSVPQADSQMIEILKVLRAKQAENLKNKFNPILGGKFSAPASFSNPFAGAFDAIRNLFASNKSGQNQTTSYEPQNAANAANSTLDKLRRLATKALFQMRIAQIFGRKQAQYLSKMMEMFENGDLQEALKHAIPLEDMQALRELTEQKPFLGFLRPRDDLQIQFGRQTSGNSSVMLGNDWFEHLRRMYRQTFERLVAQNKIEEAAFVLAELLQSNAEAVEFLEKHGKLRLAAELAESRGLPKETVVRQWFIAGEKRRAIQLAVLHNCFEYVVTKLEQENHPQSGDLREIWAENLAASGNFPAAVNVIWTLENKREKAKDWIDKVIEFGGIPAAQMLVKKITLFPQTFSEVKEKLFDFLLETTVEAAEKRIGFAREAAILKQHNDELRILARPVVRKILADWTENSRHFSPHDFRQLVAVTNDFALRTDLPRLPSNQKDAPKSESFNVEIFARDQGANQIFDACLLPDGKIAVALGESGVKILSRENKTIAHFDHPTQKFVVADSGAKAIGLMRRGDSYRLTKFDFVERRANYWCEGSFQSFAPNFDGNLWFVGLKDAIYAIDANAKNFEAVWDVSSMGGFVHEISRNKTKLTVLIYMPTGFEKWNYELPNLVLRSRNQVKGWHATTNENQALANVSASVAYSVAIKQETIAADKSIFHVEIYDSETRVGSFQLSDETVKVEKPQIVGDKYALVNRCETATTVTLYSIPNKIIASFRLGETQTAFVKLDEKFLTITDELGRIIVFDYVEKMVRKNSR